ncbi:ABC transporter substrate-binding protein [Microbacterium sp. C5A9]|uniref:ABC transporter substrate-binding protein n=1 Tax=Microbacterium sp. C5A9 TaxID=2736663 RepID=UPI001F517000|nr:ABC transporter substrate-binding protein [Microbacterium sp. C5A9]MCI1018483.1 ABC transporter substrate-binding protein [Microbacterium sp. C5A9]
MNASGNRPQRRVVTAAAATVLLGATLVACSSATTATDDASESITLGYTATLSGDFASYGLQMRQGVDLAVEELNADGGIDGRTVEIVSADDEGSPANGPVVAQQFCDESVAAVLGYSFSSVALAALPVYDTCGMPIVASAVTSPELSGASPTFFRNVFTDASQGEAMAAHVYESGVTSIAVLFQQDDYGQGISDAFSEAFEKAGGTITSAQAYQLGSVDFGTVVDTALKDDPEGLFIGGFYTETAKIAAQVRDAGSEVALYGTDGAVTPDLVALGGEAVDGMTVYSGFSTSSDDPDTQAFVAAFTEKYDSEPTSWAALAYDATKVVAQAVSDAGSTDHAAIVDALSAIEEFPGATGPISFDDEGNRLGDLIFLTVADGAFVPVSE